MILTSTEVALILNISTASSNYSLIDYYIPIVADDIYQICGHPFKEPYRWVQQDDMVFSTSKTITVNADSTVDWTTKVQVGNTIFIDGAYWSENNGFKTVSTRTTSILTLSESLVGENSTDYAVVTRIYRCDFPESVKRIAAKMIWFNIENQQDYNGDLASEGLGSYSVSYKDGTNGYSYGIYPSNLIAGLKKQVKMK